MSYRPRSQSAGFNNCIGRVSPFFPVKWTTTKGGSFSGRCSVSKFKVHYSYREELRGPQFRLRTKQQTEVDQPRFRPVLGPGRFER